jgi:hypothetical protein
MASSSCAFCQSAAVMSATPRALPFFVICQSAVAIDRMPCCFPLLVSALPSSP